MKQLILASNNNGKLKEFERLLQPLQIDVLSQGSLNVPECDEPFHTFVENALHKARHAARHTGLPALADDSGVCVPALNGAPGVYSARYAGENGDSSMSKDQKNNLKLIHDLRHIANRSAYYYCVLVLVRYADDPQPLIVDGLWWGEIVDTPLGESGFGYDPHFYIDALKATAAQLSAAQKNTLSHRGLAAQRLIERIHEVDLSKI